jgi:hypothetical protein
MDNWTSIQKGGDAPKAKFVRFSAKKGWRFHARIEASTTIQFVERALGLHHSLTSKPNPAGQERPMTRFIGTRCWNCKNSRIIESLENNSIKVTLLTIALLQATFIQT